MEKRKQKHSGMFRRILAYVLAFAMLAGLMPVTVARAEETGYETGLYFAGWDWNEKILSGLCDGLYTDIPDDAGFALIYAEKGAAETTFQYVEMSQIKVAYCSEVNDENPASLAFAELGEGQMRDVVLSENDDWAVKEIDGGALIPDIKIPVSYYNFNKTGTYKLTYTVGEKDYSCYLYMTHRSWDFYETNEVTDNPLREYYYQDIMDDNGFYLNQYNKDVLAGKLTYREDGSVATDAEGNPVLDESTPVIAASFAWDEELQQDRILEDYSDCISYDSTTGKISIIKDPDNNSTEYTVRVYFYVKDVTNDENGNPVTEYWQECTDIQVHHGEDRRNAIWLGYDEWNGMVSWKLQDSAVEAPTSLPAYQDVVGQVDGVYDVYLTEKPDYPENFDWDTATEEEKNQYGWRAGALPVVRVTSGNQIVTYRVGATESAYVIDDCKDEENTTWHFTYTYKAGDGIDVFWSDYDAFIYNDTEQFQIEVGSQGSDPAGIISVSPTPGESERFIDEAYGEKYNFAIGEIGTVSVTFTPNNGNTLEEVRIGDAVYVNETLKAEDDNRTPFTTAENGSWTYTFTEEDLKAYHWEKNESGENVKVPETDENGKQKYVSVFVEARFDGQHEDGLRQGFSWNVYPETEQLAEQGIAGVSYKVNGAEDWTFLSKDNGDNLNFTQELCEGDTITVKFMMNDGYTISNTGFNVNYQADGGECVNYKPVTAGETIEQMIAALIGEDGYTFEFTPLESSKDADGNSALTEDVALRLQFSVEKVFADKCNIKMFIQQEAGKAQDGAIIYGEMDENGSFIEDTQPNPEIAFYFNENRYGGQGVLDEETENTGENPLKIQYKSTIPGKTNGTMVEVTPSTYLIFTAGGYINDAAENQLVMEDNLIDELYIDLDGDNAFEENELVSPDKDENNNDIPGKYTIPLSAAENYSIFIRKHRSTVATLSWNYIKDESNPNQDDLVEHGKVYVKEIKRGEDIILGDMNLDQKGNVVLDKNGMPVYGIISEDKLQFGLSGLSRSGGTIWAENGDEVTLLLVPTYGYQLESASINGQEGEAQEEVSTFKLTLGGNLHFGGVFVKTEDKTDVTKAAEVSAATIANGENAADSGNLSLTVTDNIAYTTDVAASVKIEENETVEKIAALDLTLENIVSKGVENQYWTSNVTSFEKDITVGLTLDDITLAEGETFTVVRDHEGTLTELNADYDATTKTLTFPTNRFSTYTIAKKSVKQAPPEHRHSLKKTDAKAATCTTAGNKEYWICSECNKVYSDAEGKTETTVAAMVIPATGHKWDDGTVTKEATAIEAGVKTYHCTNTGCTETKTETISATGVLEKGGAFYKVTGTDTKNPTVTFTGIKDNKARTVTVPPTVTVDGVTYKVTAVADNAFSGCKKLKTVNVGSNVTRIGANAFRGCKALTKVTLPKKTTRIGANAFNGCTKLKTVTIKSDKMTSKTIDKNAFKGVSKNTTIKVPKGKAKIYKNLFQKKGLNKKVKVK